MQAAVSSIMVFAGVPSWTRRPTHLLVAYVMTDAARGIAGDNGVLQGGRRPRGQEAHCHPSIAVTSTGDGVGLHRAVTISYSRASVPPATFSTYCMYHRA